MDYEDVRSMRRTTSTMARTARYLARTLRGWMLPTSCVVALALSSAASAGTTTATIREILISNDLVYVYPAGGLVNPPSCHGGNGAYYSFSLARNRAKEYLAGLLSAQAQGASVIFYGTGACDDQPNVSETLAYFSIISGA
jgi:hypothetical protein